MSINDTIYTKTNENISKIVLDIEPALLNFYIEYIDEGDRYIKINDFEFINGNYILTEDIYSIQVSHRSINYKSKVVNIIGLNVNIIKRTGDKFSFKLAEETHKSNNSNILKIYINFNNVKNSITKFDLTDMSYMLYNLSECEYGLKRSEFKLYNSDKDDKGFSEKYFKEKININKRTFVINNFNPSSDIDNLTDYIIQPINMDFAFYSLYQDKYYKKGIFNSFVNTFITTLENVTSMRYAFAKMNYIDPVVFHNISGYNAGMGVPTEVPFTPNIWEVNLEGAFADTSFVKYDSPFFNTLTLGEIKSASHFTIICSPSLKDTFRKIENIKFIASAAFYTDCIEDCSYMFYDAKNIDSLITCPTQLYDITGLGFINYDTIKSESIHYLDFDLSKIKQYDKPMLTSTAYMFYNVGKNIKDNENTMFTNINELNTVNVTNMSHMYYNCNLQRYFYVSSDIDTSSVEDMSYMFYGVSNQVFYTDDNNEVNKNNITQAPLNFNSWNTCNVKNMSHMFENSNTYIYGLTNWDVSNVADMSYMFAQDNKDTLFNINENDFDNWDVSNVINMSYMFYNNVKLDSNHNIYPFSSLENWNTYNVKNMSHMFDGCTELKKLNLTYWNISQVTDTSYMFNNCVKLQNIGNIKYWDISKNTNTSYMFNNCVSLQTLGNIQYWNIENVLNSSYMFSNCTSLTSIDKLNNWNVSHIEDMNHMFDSCININNLGQLNSWILNDNCDLSYIFNNCSKLEIIGDLSSWDINNKNIDSIFNSCGNLIDINLYNNKQVNNSNININNCNSVQTLDLSNITINNIDEIHLVQNCNTLCKVDLSNLKYTGIINDFGMNCPILSYVDLSYIDFTKTKFNNFLGNKSSNIQTIDFRYCKGITIQLLQSLHLLENCKKIKEVNVNGLDETTIECIKVYFNNYNPYFENNVIYLIH